MTKKIKKIENKKENYSYEMTHWVVFMRLCDLKYQTTRQSEFSRSLSKYVINEQLPKDPSLMSANSYI